MLLRPPRCVQVFSVTWPQALFFQFASQIYHQHNISGLPRRNFFIILYYNILYYNILHLLSVILDPCPKCLNKQRDMVFYRCTLNPHWLERSCRLPAGEHLIRMPPERLCLDVYWVHATDARPPGRPRARWRHETISNLAWVCLEMPRWSWKVSLSKGRCGAPHSALLPLRPDPG